MYRRFALFAGLSLEVLLAGCSATTSVPKHEPGPGPALPITVQAGTLPSRTKLIETTFRIGRPGTYQYALAYAHLPQQTGGQPELCLPQSGFRLTSDGGTVSFLGPGPNLTGAATGSVQLSAGTWTASSGFLGLEQL